ncbi:MAG TPA: hypothetical protein VF011_15315 [Terriglobales bacterium]
MFQPSPYRKLGIAWVGLCLAVAVHITDEALTGFLSVYNPTVIAMRERWGWFPMPAFGFREWLDSLIAGVVVALLLSPLVFRGSRLIRPLAWFLSIVMIINAGGHTLATILGQTVASVHFARPAPGFYSSPLLLLASIYLIVQLRRTGRIRSGDQKRSAIAIS